MKEDLKQRAEAAVKAQGFDNLANAVRFWTVNAAAGNFSRLPYPRIEPVNIPRLARLADKYEEQMERGDYTGLKVFDNVEDLINDLNQNDEFEVTAHKQLQKELPAKN